MIFAGQNKVCKLNRAMPVGPKLTDPVTPIKVWTLKGQRCANISKTSKMHFKKASKDSPVKVGGPFCSSADSPARYSRPPMQNSSMLHCIGAAMRLSHCRSHNTPQKCATVPNLEIFGLRLVIHPFLTFAQVLVLHQMKILINTIGTLVTTVAETFHSM